MLDRMQYLDALRGLAAFAVVIGHFFFGEWKNLPVINLISDTKLAVAIFFVLSGVVLTNEKGMINQPPITLLLTYGLARFTRLFIPILSVSIFVALLYSLGFMFNGQLNENYLGWVPYLDFYQTEVGVAKVISFASVETFLIYNPELTLIPPAWTMRPELFGSFAVIAYIWILNRGYIKPRPVLLSVIAFFLVATEGNLPFIHFLGYFLSGCALRHAADLNVKISHPSFCLLAALLCKTLLAWQNLGGIMIDFIFATLIIFFLMQAKSLHKEMCGPVLLWLGRISFPLYLLHVPLIMSLGLHTMQFLGNMGVPAAVGQWLVFVVLTIVLFFLSNLFLPVERVAIRASRTVRNLFSYAST